jgi:hypothetical protein
MSAPPQLTPPKCPHCDERLPVLGLYAYEVPGYAILDLYCPHCERALHWQIFQRQAAADPAPPPKSTIWKPS